ncbi:MAG: signal recognition particle protein Srp19 [Euryarchaeota archaeon]|nr:signal recognition particle protein Srp19 [Euryarchaeota archaeon]
MAKEFDADKAWVLWPEYFDVDRTRRQGRRVKKGLAVKEPQLVNVIKAVEKLGLGWKVEDGKSYPGAWWNKQGMLLVENNMAKTKLLTKVAQELQRVQRS